MLSSTTASRDPRPPSLPLESMVSALTRRAGLDRPAYTHVDYHNRSAESHTLTWTALYARMLAVAARIRQVAEPADRVAILCPQDLTFPVAFFGALGADTIAVPLFAPEMSSHAERLVGAIADCEPTVWLTSESATGPLQALLADPRVPRPREVIAVDGVEGAGSSTVVPAPAVDLDAAAYLQYTSGSTREPAGAIITHRAIAINVLQSTAAYELDEDCTMVGWIPLFHDMGLMLMMCTPAVIGMRSVFSAPFDFVRRPRRWLEQLAGYPDVITAAPNFAFDYAVQRVSEQDRASLDLSGVRAAVNGAEPVRPSTIERFQAHFGACGFAAEAHRPSYGLAEATVFVSASPAGTPPRVTSFDRARLTAGRAVPADGDAEAIRLVSAGVPVGQHVCIAGAGDGVARPDGEVGEVWVHGANVAAGYWGQPERSRETFDGQLVGGGDERPTAGWLRTGDLGVHFGGELYITGRLKDVIIVDGKNHYPQDIEETVQEAHPAVAPGRVAAFEVPAQAGAAIIVALERGRGADAAAADPAEIVTAVRRAVSAVHDLKLDDIQILDGSKVLRTSSGKIARTANRDRYVAERGR